MLKAILSDKNWHERNQGREIFLEALGTILINRGNSNEIQGLFAMLTELPRWQATSLVSGAINHQRNQNEVIIMGTKPNIFNNNNRKILGIDLSELEDVFQWPGKPSNENKEPKSRNRIDRNIFVLGRQKYLNLCASCHGTDGQGMKRFAPPLKNSEWVTGDADKLAMLLLHGMEGPIEVAGKRYDIPDILPVMPAFSTLQITTLVKLQPILEMLGATRLDHSQGNG